MQLTRLSSAASLLVFFLITASESERVVEQELGQQDVTLNDPFRAIWPYGTVRVAVTSVRAS